MWIWTSAERRPGGPRSDGPLLPDSADPPKPLADHTGDSLDISCYCRLVTERWVPGTGPMDQHTQKSGDIRSRGPRLTVEYPHLSKAPITEAVFDIRVRARAELKASEFEQLHTKLPQYPGKNAQRAFEASFEVGPGGLSKQGAKVSDAIGYRFESADKKQLVQFRLDGFTFNKLAPYSSWDELLPVVLDLWQLYAATARPHEVVRVALRYINHIELPASLEDFDEVMTAPPPVPKPFPQLVSQFLTRVSVHDHQLGHSAHVAQALPPAAGPPGNLILDIDAFHERELSLDANNIKRVLASLHDFKNRLFFASLTPATVERYR